MSEIVPPTRVAPILPAAPMRNRLIRTVSMFFALKEVSGFAIGE